MRKSKSLSDHKALYYLVLPFILLFIWLSNAGSYLYNFPVADPGEAPHPLFLDQNGGPKAQNIFFLEIPPPPPLISRSGTGTAFSGRSPC